MSIADGDPGAYDTLILGIGNILWADEGFGIRTIETLHERYTFPDNVRVMDGGTQGIFLLPWVRNAKRLLIFDAVDFGLAPATLKVIRDDEVPRFMGAKKVSMHQTGFQEVLASADLAGDLPLQMVLIGVQPELLDDYGGSLRHSVKTKIDPAIERGLAILNEWNVSWELRGDSLPREEHIGPTALDIQDYENERPSTGGEPV
ncbi:MAG: HyaD/HybD family hydrogenase maturation endopeptidase [Gammaproteobacteria bacterium]|nr:HyaD/HybD family hydrogenase maturation endopeptidase [Gammaproteobacteria bacterium]